ncbi:sensor histidine kinase [Flavisphingomonas formosensis]|uniref:sensor histidine kinase n=1 Tax=Flavisphingomonas formosensis TaxID=861534 RepID=UPI0018E041CD|nr:ATP-binding protein [Sphingomonas formosensis]
MRRSLTFRLALTYVGLFLGSLLSLCGAAFWLSVHRPMQEELGIVAAEADTLARIDAAHGRPALIEALQRRVRKREETVAFHALIASDGEAITANLPSWPRKPITHSIRLEADVFENGIEHDEEALVVERALSDGARLIVGRDVEMLADRERLFAQGALWLGGAAILLTIIGGFAMSRAVGMRLDAINRTARRVMEGDLHERIAIRGSGDDFDDLAITLNGMLARIEDLMESVRRVSDNIAHELRTPLARLHADLDELRRAADAQERETLVEQAIDEAARLRAVFDALLKIARIESGRHAAGLRAIDLAALLADAVEFHQPEAESHGQSIVTEIEPGLALCADPDLIFQAVSNLLDNAIKYGGVGGHILVTADRSGACTRIAVSDDGPGILPEHVTRVTERFFRAPNAVLQPGTGLGLSLVAAIVSFHRGKLVIVPAAAGTRVEMLLP